MDKSKEQLYKKIIEEIIAEKTAKIIIKNVDKRIMRVLEHFAGDNNASQDT